MIRNIVVIDDEIEYLNLITEFSAISSLHAACFSEWSSEILAQLKNDTLVFLDINMPKKDGIDALVVLSEYGYSGGIVLLSGAEESVLTSVQKLGESLNLNMFGSLPKPFSLQKLESIIHRFSTSQQPAKSSQSSNTNLSFDLDKIKHYVAEGVETIKQLNLIKELNCNLVQGYIYSRPLLFPEFSDFLNSFNV